MKTNCSVIRDLLPLYAEKLTGEESNALIREHLAECEECSGYLKKLQKPVEKEAATPSSNGNSLKLVQRGIRSRKATAVLFAALLVFTLMLSVFSHLEKPDYISYQNSGITVVEAGNGDVYAQISGRVTSCRVVRWTGEDGQTVVDIQAWTSPWDKLLGKATPSVLISSKADPADIAYYCDLTRTAENMTAVYGTDQYEHITSLPRLVLGYYFIAAFVAAAIAGAAFFIFRKNKKARAVCGYVFAAPLSYMLGHLIITTGFTTFSAANDFILNCIGAIAIYGMLILGAALLRQRRQDAIDEQKEK